MLKRALDVTIAVLGLILLSPLLVVMAILVRLDSRGPIFYRAPRVGKDGMPFRMFKFRTMVTDAESIGPAITLGQDPRITRLGGHLRKSRLDEIPQLLNVLQGQMSMVGPRPEAPYYVEMYSPEQRKVLAAKPGMTGPAQIAFRHEEEDLADPETLDEQYMTVILPPKLAMDLAYIEHPSVVMDLKLLFHTAWVLLADRLGPLSRDVVTRVSAAASRARRAWKRVMAERVRALPKAVASRVSNGASWARSTWRRKIADPVRALPEAVASRVSNGASRARSTWRRKIADPVRALPRAVASRVSNGASRAGLAWRGTTMELHEIIAVLRRRFWLLIAGAGLAVLGSYLAFRLLTPWPRYEASVTAILGNASLNADWASLQANRELATTYVDWATRRPVLQGVIEALSLPMSAEELRGRINARVVGNTQMIEISATSPGRYQAAAIANEVVRQLEREIRGTVADENDLSSPSGEDVTQLEERIASTEAELISLTDLLMETDSLEEADLLTRRITVLQSNLAMWQEQHTEIMAQLANRPTIRLIVVEEAQAPLQAANPLLNILVAGVAGLAAAMGAILLHETRHRSDSLPASDDVQASYAWFSNALEGIEDRPVPAGVEGDRSET